MDKHRKFNSLLCCLDNVNVIEASAGTGKTYNIQNLYARLILLKGFSVDSILVVTFTDASAKELKDRIRSILNEINLYYQKGSASEEIIKLSSQGYYIDKSGCKYEVDLKTRKNRLALAIRDFDNAAIYTIHGFCRKMLNDYSFESGILFNVELEKDIAPILQDIVEDFWRRESYNVDSFNTALIKYNEITIKTLISFVKNFTNKGDVEIEPKKITRDCTTVIREIFYKMKGHWDRDAILELLKNPYLNQKTFKPLQIEKICFNTELFLQGIFNNTTFPEIEKITQENIDKAFTAAGKKAGEISPQHPFFRDCSELTANKKLFKSFGTLIRHRCRVYFDSEYEKRKTELNIQTFNDLLTRVEEYVNNSKSPLLPMIQKQFNAALIDEFQDTDSIQYNIFRKIFIDSDKPLFVVGDPKQAIYGFRGGDIFTYRKAKDYIRKTGEVFTLDKNWRSSPNMVNAINSFYGKNEPSYVPFVTKAIDFINVDSDKKNDNFSIDALPDPQPLKLLYLPGTYNTEKLRQACCTRTSSEIYELLTNNLITITDNEVKRKILPKDIAVLVTTHHQARLLQPELNKLNIPAVIQATGSVFDSIEAEHLEYVLRAIAEPTNTKILKGAMLTDIMGYSINDIADIIAANDTESNTALDSIYSNFKEYHEKWLSTSFIEMYNTFAVEYSIKNTLLSQIEGERKLTNILHLAEILHQQEIDSKLGINGLIYWLSKQRNTETRNDKEEYEIRLETDDDAVKIMTVFRAKGLEFPIVFCPFLWDKNAIPYKDKSTVFKYHETPDFSSRELNSESRAPEDTLSPEYKCILDISGSETAKNISYDESLEELTRLMYVALTRSKYICYILWGHTGARSTKNTSALDYQFYSNEETIKNGKGTVAVTLKSIAQLAKDTVPFPYLTDGQRKYIKLDTSETEIFSNLAHRYNPNQCSSVNNFSCRKFPGKLIDHTWMFASFSSLAPYDTGNYKPDIAISKDHDENDNIVSENIQIPADSSINIFNFLAGAKTGTCWHEIFEDLNFKADDEVIAETVKEKLTVYSLNNGNSEAEVYEKEACVINMVKNVLNATLSMENKLKLSYIDNSDKLSEMEFNFSLNKRFTTDRISDCLIDFTKKFGINSKNIVWNQHLVTGFMTGFIDLVFRHNNNFYIVDWKSNKLDGSPEGFDQNGLKAEIGRHHYYLQYLIYTVALDKYLSMTMKNYDYDKHYGGIYYIFLRGVCEDDTDRGIFYDRPEKELIRELAGILS